MLVDASRRNPSSWRRVSAIGARTGIKGDELEQVIADVVAAGLPRPRLAVRCVVQLVKKIPGGDVEASAVRGGLLFRGGEARWGVNEHRIPEQPMSDYTAAFGIFI